MKLATLLRLAALRTRDADQSFGEYFGMCFALDEVSCLHPPNVCTSVTDKYYYWCPYTFIKDWTWPTLAQHGFEKVPVHDYWWPCTEKFVQTRINALNLLADYAEYLDL